MTNVRDEAMRQTNIRLVNPNLTSKVYPTMPKIPTPLSGVKMKGGPPEARPLGGMRYRVHIRSIQMLIVVRSAICVHSSLERTHERTRQQTKLTLLGARIACTSAPHRC